MSTTVLPKGTTLSGYRIDGVLGQGGMGIVYEATHLSLQRVIALKVLAEHLSDDVSFTARFQREGQIQAGIDHPHIVTVFDSGQSEHGFFIAMRLVRGPNLKDLIVSRELDSGRALRILSPIGDALDTAHDAGLVHRDIKPQNILVGGRDQAYLADFGLTKAAGDKSLTRTGQFVGTLDYIAPEQIKGEPATKASDVYALAAVLYECLTGIVPFPKDSEAAVLYAHMADPAPRVSETRPDLPGDLDAVLARAMSKDPKERQESAGKLLAEGKEAFTRGTRAAFKSPGPIERAEEAGIRRAEHEVPTRETEQPASETAAGQTRVSPADTPPAAAPIDETIAGPTGETVPLPVTPDAQNEIGSAPVREERTVVPPQPGARPEPVTRQLGPEPPARRRGPAALLVAGAIALLIGLAVAGYLIGSSGSDEQATPPAGDAVAAGLRESDDYVRTLDRAIGQLNASRRQGVRDLGRARQAPGQANAAGELSKAYEIAARSVGDATPGPELADESRAIVRSLEQVGSAYERLAGRARAGDAGGYNAARRNVRQGETALRKALGRVESAQG